MPKKTDSKAPSSEPFSLIPKATQRALYEHVSVALKKGAGNVDHNEVAEIAAGMALSSSDIVVGSNASRGLRLVRENTVSSCDRLRSSIAAAVESLCSASANAVALVTGDLGTAKVARQTFTFLGRTKLPVIVLTRTGQGSRNGKVLDLRTVHAEFGIPVITVDGNDAIAVYRVMTEAAHNSRVGRGASIIETVAIGKSPQRVASPCPLECLERYMRRHGAWFHN